MIVALEQEFPPVSWDEVSEKLVRDLFIDDQWSTRGQESMSWWPWFLRQDIAATAKGTLDDERRRDNYLRVTVSTEVCRLDDEDLGLAVVGEVNEDFPFGSFLLRDRVIRAETSLLMNPLCRELVEWLVTATLVQATLSHQLALSLEDERGVEVLRSMHPTSGPRAEPDELLAVYAGEDVSFPRVDDLGFLLMQAKPIYRDQLVRLGYQAAYSDEEVDYFGVPPHDIAIGRLDDEDHRLVRRYGSGLVVMARILLPGQEISWSEINDMNEEMASYSDRSSIGSVVGGQLAEAYGLCYRSYLDHGFLSRERTGGAEALAMAIVNAVGHAIGPWVQFLSRFSDDPEGGT